MNAAEFAKKIKAAEANVKSLDAAGGWAHRNPQTILAALECGIMRPETNAHFDAVVMLRDLVTAAVRNN